MTAKIMTIFNPKGGCGKTNTSMQLGAAFHYAGLKTAVIDMDRQGSAFLWSKSGAADLKYPAEVLNFAPLKQTPKMIGAINDIVDEYDILIIDCPLNIESSPWAALSISNIGIIPVIPAPVEIWAAIEAKDVALDAMKDNPTLQLFTLASMVRRGAVITECIKTLAQDTTIPLLKTMLTQRNDYLKSQAYGLAVQDISKDSAASLEIEVLSQELLSKLITKEVA